MTQRFKVYRLVIAHNLVFLKIERVTKLTFL